MKTATDLGAVSAAAADKMPMVPPSPPLPSSSSSTTPERSLDRRRNTHNLGLRIGSDVLSAASAGALVAPIVSVIDRSIMENASGRATLSSSLRSSLATLILRPHALLLSRPTALVFLLYGATYLTANTVDTAHAVLAGRPAAAVTSGADKFVASSAANVGLCVYKDRVFVRMFGPPGAVPRPVPLASTALFTLRDCMTIFASFNLPPLLAPYLDSRLSADLKRHVSGLTAAQFMAPAGVQLFSTPLHLLGLDLYNRPGSSPFLSWRDRLDLVRRNWFVSVSARICRIVPAFGVGGVANMKVRQKLMEAVA